MKAKYRIAAVAVAILLSSAIAKAEMSLEEQELVCHQGANAFAQGVKLSKHQSSNHQINYLTKQMCAFSATAHCRLVTQRPRQDVQTAVARQYDY
jgi:hypothetical protein